METDALSQAFEQFRLGRLDLAARHCRTVLARNPDHAEINHLLGAIRFQEGDSDGTSRSYRQKDNAKG